MQEQGYEKTVTIVHDCDCLNDSVFKEEEGLLINWSN